MHDMAKAEMIRQWLDMGLPTREIADLVGCCTAYVRAVRRRARNKETFGSCLDDRETRYQRDYARKRYANDPAYRKARIASVMKSQAKRRKLGGSA